MKKLIDRKMKNNIDTTYSNSVGAVFSILFSLFFVSLILFLNISSALEVTGIMFLYWITLSFSILIGRSLGLVWDIKDYIEKNKANEENFNDDDFIDMIIEARKQRDEYKDLCFKYKLMLDKFENKIKNMEKFNE